MLKQEINNQLEQYRLEVQNKELLVQINAAEKTIINQNQHIAELYSSMGVIVGILTLIVAIFGIAIPLWAAKNAKNMEKELKENISRVNDFIANKFKEWEQQDINKALDGYLHEKLSWWNYHTVLKWQTIPFEHMQKIINNAQTNGRQLPYMYAEKIEDLAYYLFVENKDKNNDDFTKARNLIISSKYLPYILFLNPKIYRGILEFIPQNKWNDYFNKALLLCDDENKLAITIQILIFYKIEQNEEIKNTIVNQLQLQDGFAPIRAVQNNKTIVDALINSKFLQNISHCLSFQGNLQFNYKKCYGYIDINSYLAKKIIEMKSHCNKEC